MSVIKSVVDMSNNEAMHKYKTAYKHIKDMIQRGVLKPGSKVPSIRKLSHQLNLSAITVQHSYDLLQAEGLIVAKTRSGFFVPSLKSVGSDASAVKFRHVHEVTFTELTYATLLSSSRNGNVGLGGVNPHPDLFKQSNFGRYLRQISRKSASFWTADPPEGNVELRQAIANGLADRGFVVCPEDVVITGTGMQGFELCLDLVSEAGDTVIVDAPTYLPLLASLKSRKLKIIELYSHPVLGVDPDQLSFLLSNYKVKAVVLSPLNHFPTGVTSKPEALRKIARVAESHKVPVLEVDIFSELGYETEPEPPLAAYTSHSEVYLFGSFIHTIGPDYSLGWVVNRGAAKGVTRQKYENNLMLGDSLLQRAIAEYMQDRQYKKDLNKLRSILSSGVSKGISTLREALPSSFKIFSPGGGYMCWVRGASDFDSLAASKIALDMNMSLTAGQMFSPSNGFQSFLGINLSGPWTHLEDARGLKLSLILEAAHTHTRS